MAAVRRPGRAPHQLLLFGAGVLAGDGLRSHDIGLPGAVADELAARSGRGVDMTVVVDDEPTSRRALEGLRGLRLWRFDAIVIVLGERAALARTKPGHWRNELEGLAALLCAESVQGTPKFLYASARTMLGRASANRRAVVTATRHLAVESELAARSGLRFAELAPPLHTINAGGRFSPVAYQSWAQLVVQRLWLELAPADEWLSSPTVHSLRDQPDNESLRQQGLACLQLRQDDRSELLDFIVRQAKVLFGTGFAALNIIDGDQQWQAATTGTPRTAPRESAFCNITIQRDDLTLINDTHRDPRVSDSPLAERIRFYAGYPIRTWDGYRVGALCIYDENPRQMRDSDLQELRDFAGRIEQELWSAALRTRS